MIVIPQLVITAIGVAVSGFKFIDFGKVTILRIPFMVIGILLILYGLDIDLRQSDSICNTDYLLDIYDCFLKENGRKVR